MVKAKRNDRGSKPRLSSHKANATGYAKRHSRKAKSLTGLSDVYEYAPDPKIRRSKVALDIGRDEAAEFGVSRGGDEEANDGEDIRTKARLIGEGDEIDSEDDEDIDSDAAFEESDEERFAGFGFSSEVRMVKFQLSHPHSMLQFFRRLKPIRLKSRIESVLFILQKLI